MDSKQTEPTSGAHLLPSAPAAPAVVSADPPPVRPIEPDPEDCCGEGCVRCVNDRYDEAMERYAQTLAAWQVRQPGLVADEKNGGGRCVDGDSGSTEPR